jgi:ActR/RegA family two-component response regulator
MNPSRDRPPRFIDLGGIILWHVEHQPTSALVVSIDLATRQTLRWIVGEFVDEVLVAVSWTDALTIAQRKQLQLAVLDFDGLNAPGRRWLVDVLHLRAHASIVAVGTLPGLQNAAVVGVGLGVLKPIKSSSLIGQIERAVTGPSG